MSLKPAIFAGLALVALSACVSTDTDSDRIDAAIGKVVGAEAPSPADLAALEEAAADALGRAAAAQAAGNVDDQLYRYNQAARAFQALSLAEGPQDEDYRSHRNAMFEAAASATDLCRDEQYDERLGHLCASSASLYSLEDSINNQMSLHDAVAALDYEAAQAAALEFRTSVTMAWPVYEQVVAGLPQATQDQTGITERRMIVACNFVVSGGLDQFGTRQSGDDETARQGAAAAFLLAAGEAAAAVNIGDDGPACGPSEMSRDCADYRFFRLAQACLDRDNSSE